MYADSYKHKVWQVIAAITAMTCENAVIEQQ